MIDLIYIGDYKTGTSWWQTQVLPNHAEICYLDDPLHFPEIVHLMHELVDARDLDFNAPLLRAKFKKILNNIDSKGKKKVICREALSGKYPTGENAKRTADRLREVFGETKILIVIREQLSMLKTTYSQYIKIGGTLDFKSFVYDPIASPGLIERLKYHKIINCYLELFGEDNVYVGLFEDFKSDNERFVNHVLNFIGCTSYWKVIKKNNIINPSLTRGGLVTQRFMNHFVRNDWNPRVSLIPIDRFIAFFLNEEKKKEVIESTKKRLIYSLCNRDDTYILHYAINFSLTLRLSKFCEGIQVGSKLSVPESIVSDLDDEFRKSNRVLRDKYCLSVDDFGWKL